MHSNPLVTDDYLVNYCVHSQIALDMGWGDLVLPLNFGSRGFFVVLSIEFWGRVDCKSSEKKSLAE
jgi:hypothetical protein